MEVVYVEHLSLEEVEDKAYEFEFEDYDETDEAIEFLEETLSLAEFFETVSFS